mgnify:CR=1 FL=1
MADTQDVFTIGSHQFRSRLLVGTGKYASLDTMKQAESQMMMRHYEGFMQT